MRKIRIGYRLTFLCLVVLAGSVLTVLFLRGSMPPESIQSRVTRWWHRGIARGLGMRIHVQGTPRRHATLYVSNHLSSFDIPALGTILPTRFLSKIELKSWPLMGWLATRAGTLYIARGGRQAAASTNRLMAQALSEGQNVVLFAEGTVKDGTVIRFHSRLMQSAVDSCASVQPVAIRYPIPDDSGKNPAAMVIGSMNFSAFASRVLAAREMHVELSFGDVVGAENKSRDELARHAEEEVRRMLDIQISDCA